MKQVHPSKNKTMSTSLSASSMEDQENPESNPKTDADNKAAAQSGGVIWKVSSSLYNIGSGAVGLGVGGVKWAATTSYNIGTGVVSATQSAVSKVVPVRAPKPKKE